MKNIATIAVIVLFATSAYATDEKSGSLQGGMMQSDMMKNCQHHMKDGKMMDSMPKDMMAQCQEMMKDGMMDGKGRDGMKSNAANPEAPKADDSADHAKHHPAQ